jgi:hypothetical protein
MTPKNAADAIRSIQERELATGSIDRETVICICLRKVGA